jgi:hypothetical protein
MYQNINFLVLIKSNGNLNHSLEDLAKKAQKVLLSIKSRVASSLGNIPIKVSSANNNDPMLELTSLGGSDATELKLASISFI